MGEARPFDMDGDLESHYSPPIPEESQDEKLTELAAGPPVSEGSNSEDPLEIRQSRAESRRLSQPSHLSRDEELTEVAGGEPCARGRDEEVGEGRGGRGGENATAQPGHVKRDCLNKLDRTDQSESNFTRSQFATELYVHGYLIFYSILGVLARLGVKAITLYPGAPAISPVLWANFGGSLFFGFLAEDQRLFREEWGRIEESSFHNSKRSSSESQDVLSMTKKKHLGVKKTIPLYIGLSTGFCGSFTSFSAFISDAFLALSNSLRSPDTPSTNAIPHRHDGYSVNAVLAIIILHVTVSLSALHFGAHIALAFDHFTPSLPFQFCRRLLDPLSTFLGIGCWIGAILLAIFPPKDTWRGRAAFSCVFGPLGCLLRYHVSRKFNARIPSFPLGTFVVNVFGTLVLGMCYDLQHLSQITALGGGHASVVGCQLLEGVIQGFCGALTTVSTWVGELNGLRRRHAYVYGVVSIVVSLGFLIAIMGGLRWSEGFGKLACKT